MTISAPTTEERLWALDRQLFVYATAVKYLRDLQEVEKLQPGTVDPVVLAQAAYDVDWLTQIHLIPTAL
jgi:hypothetical protein